MKKIYLFCMVCIIAFQFHLNALAEEEQILSIAGQDIYQYEAIQQFQGAHPTITVQETPIASTYDDMIRLMITGDSTADIYVIYNTQYGTLDAIKKKGLFADLSTSEHIQNHIAAMPQRIQDTFTKDGQICAYPIDVILGNAFFIDYELMNEVGLDDQIIPHSFFDLLKMDDTWNEIYEEKFPEYEAVTGLTTIDPEWPYMEMGIDMYMDYCMLTDGKVQFDTPLFHQLMDAILKKHVKISSFAQNQLYELNDEEGFIFAQYKCDASSMFMRWSRQALPALSLTEDGSPMAPISFVCLVVNPYGSNQDDAKELVSYFAKYPNLYANCVLSLDAEPIADPNWESYVEDWKKTKDDALRRLPDAYPDEKPDLEITIDNAQWYLDHQEDFRYYVSPTALNSYRQNILPYLFVRGNSIYDAPEIRTQIAEFLKQYKDGLLQIEQLMTQLDCVIQMRIAEGVEN